MALAVLAGCGGNPATPARGSDPVAKPSPREATRQAILRNMPINSQQRCVGISIVTEALLDSLPAVGAGRETVEDAARRLYRGLGDQQPTRLPPQLLIFATVIDIDSPAAIAKLSLCVTDLYKQDFARLSKTEAGRQKLLAAEDRFVATDAELERILEGDPDRTEAFFGSGSRIFPDGTVETTHHVFLIGRQADGQKCVYDSNDPGRPIACQLANRRQGVEVEWTCQYRDTGQETTQRYLIVDKDTFFRIILAE